MPKSCTSYDSVEEFFAFKRIKSLQQIRSENKMGISASLFQIHSFVAGPLTLALKKCHEQLMH